MTWRGRANAGSRTAPVPANPTLPPTSPARRASRSTLQRLADVLQVRPSALLHAARQEVIALAGSHGCEVIGAFGSVADGTDHPDSDIDLIVSFPENADISTCWRLRKSCRTC